MFNMYPILQKTRTAKGRQQFPQQLLIQERDEKIQDVSSVEYIDPNQTNNSNTPEKYRGDLSSFE